MNLGYNIIGDNMEKKKDIFDEMEEKNVIKSEQTEIKIPGIKEIGQVKIFPIILSSILVILSIYNLYININKVDDINLNYLIINSSILTFIAVNILLVSIFKNKLETFFKVLLVFSLIGYVSFNILTDNNVIKISKQKLMPELVGMKYQDVQNWSKEHNITLDVKYEYSDIYKEYEIISQDISTDTLLKKVTKVSIVISSGPNYDKTVVISNMNGWNIDDAIEVINQNFLNNVIIDYVLNNEYDKDIIISQNIKGNIRRNDKLILTVSLGEISDEIEMIDIKDMSLFDLRLWLKRNGIKYTEEYKYDENIKRNEIISVNKKQGDVININTDKINVLISKGNPIKVPNILSMSIEDVTKWIIENNLKIDYEDKYDDNIPLGGIIKCNYEEGSEIEEETLIKVTTSKGPLKMESFDSLNDFRSWAEKYNISYNEEYQYNDTVSRGKIIKFSLNPGDIIKNNQSITVYISNGKPITIPNFVNKTKSEATTLCNNLGLRCSFVYGSYSSISKDTVTSQNKKSGISVISGTSITLTLSKGKANSCSIYIPETWFADNADGTISSLKTHLSNELKNKGCTDVNFNYVKRCYNSGRSGMIASDSPTHGANNTFTDGKTYTFYIIDFSKCH